MSQVPLDKVFIVSFWTEAVLYGFVICLFFCSVYVNVSLRKHQDGHSRIMFYIGIIMFLMATLHIALNCFRMIEGYVVHASEPGGPAAFLGVLSTWHHIFKDVVYATQELMGDAVAIYRTWVVWSRDWRVVVPLICILLAQAISGYSTAALYRTIDPTASIFDPVLLHWISAFYATTFVQSFLTTFLMAYRIGMADRKTAKYRMSSGSLMPVLRILIESAALQLVIEFIVLILYACNHNTQYILLETITPIVAITFNAITIRIAMRSSEILHKSEPSQHHVSNQQQSSGLASAIPMRPITINIKQDVEAHGDGRSDSDLNFDHK